MDLVQLRPPARSLAGLASSLSFLPALVLAANVNVSDVAGVPAGNESEVMIAVNPTDPHEGLASR